MPVTAPKSLRIRMYNVGFGDCFLLTFEYAGDRRDRRILVDCGSVSSPKHPASGESYSISDVTADIAQACGATDRKPGKLDVLIATHRHRDHISGFAVNNDGEGPGAAIAALTPSLVIQPWTEDPELPTDATSPIRTGRYATENNLSGRRELASLQAMADFLESRVNQLADNQQSLALAGFDPDRLEALQQLIWIERKNEKAVLALVNMADDARRKKYVSYGDQLNLGWECPGVKIHVLGPPTGDQLEVLGAGAHQASNFWEMHAVSARQSMGSEGTRQLFDQAFINDDSSLLNEQWLKERLNAVYLDRLYGITETMDKDLNNTSLILLFECGNQFFLFSGDAEVENWSYALSRGEFASQLSQVWVYKVGHHGSKNATPKKALWEKYLQRDGDVNAPLTTFLSATCNTPYECTRPYKQVPRKSVVNALQSQSELVNSMGIDGDGKFCRYFEKEFVFGVAETS